MALAMKCDRCGKYYEYCYKDINAIALLTYDAGKDKYCDKIRFDICPDCAESFDEWITKSVWT